MSDWEATRDWKRLQFQRPAFHPADLHLVVDLLSDPVTRAIGNDAFRFREPNWSEGRPALVFLGEALSNALATAIGRGALSFQEPPDWSKGLSATYRVFGLDRPHHLFRAEPIDWGPLVTFKEPQLTKGFAHFLDVPERERVFSNSATRASNAFAHFLDVPERERQIGRTRALLKALGVPGPGEDMNEIEVTPEASPSGKEKDRRIDILIEWKDSSGSCYAAIEAKFGAKASKGQLSAYRKGLQERWPEHRLDLPRSGGQLMAFAGVVMGESR